eukprot:scaffold1610_cov257-Pinguiococcus_pyrenoidosus.AAC.57
MEAARGPSGNGASCATRCRRSLRCSTLVMRRQWRLGFAPLARLPSRAATRDASTMKSPMLRAPKRHWQARTGLADELRANARGRPHWVAFAAEGRRYQRSNHSVLGMILRYPEFYCR